MFKGFKEIVPLMMAGILIVSAISAFRDAIGCDVSMLLVAPGNSPGKEK